MQNNQQPTIDVEHTGVDEQAMEQDGDSAYVSATKSQRQDNRDF